MRMFKNYNRFSRFMYCELHAHCLAKMPIALWMTHCWLLAAFYFCIYHVSCVLWMNYGLPFFLWYKSSCFEYRSISMQTFISAFNIAESNSNGNILGFIWIIIGSTILGFKDNIFAIRMIPRNSHDFCKAIIIILGNSKFTSF